MRKRKLYLSEFLARYHEEYKYRFEIFPKNEGQFIFTSLDDAYDYLTSKYLDMQVTKWETYNQTIFIFIE